MQPNTLWSYNPENGPDVIQLDLDVISRKGTSLEVILTDSGVVTPSHIAAGSGGECGFLRERT